MVLCSTIYVVYYSLHDVMCPRRSVVLGPIIVWHLRTARAPLSPFYILHFLGNKVNVVYTDTALDISTISADAAKGCHKTEKFKSSSFIQYQILYTIGYFYAITVWQNMFYLLGATSYALY